MTCGIYGIRNKINNKLYIGQSINIEKRYASHLRQLKNNKHVNKHLQSSYLKYGADNFELIILVECLEESLATEEQNQINLYSHTQIYNKMLDVHNHKFTKEIRIKISELKKGTSVGEFNPFFGKKHTNETKAKMGERKKKAYIGAGNPNYGKKNTLETRIKMSEGRGKLTKELVLEIVELLKLDLPHQEIANKFNVGRTVITRISNGTRWTNVTGGPVTPVIYKGGIRQFSEIHRKRIGESRKNNKKL
jgi:group I intron endonuclease